MTVAKRAAVSLVSLAALASGLTAALGRRRRRRGDYRLFVLEYHDISSDGSEREGVISQTRFRRHLSYLKRRYRLLPFGRGADLLDRPHALDKDLLAITFDDGYEDNFAAAWPVLKAETVGATIFLTTGFLDGRPLWFDTARRSLEAARRTDLPDEARGLLTAALGRWPLAAGVEAELDRLKYLPPAERERLVVALSHASPPRTPPAPPLTWEQVREMHANGIEMGCHTVTHPILSLLPREGQSEEIHRSRERIAQETGVPPSSFAFPNGSLRDFNADTLEILRDAGFAAACTTRRGSNRPGCDRLTLRRIGVGSDPRWVLAARLSGLFDDEVRKLLPGRRSPAQGA